MHSHFVVARQLVLEHAKPDETVCGFLLATIAFRIVTLLLSSRFASSKMSIMELQPQFSTPSCASPEMCPQPVFPVLIEPLIGPLDYV